LNYNYAPYKTEKTRLRTTSESEISERVTFQDFGQILDMVLNWEICTKLRIYIDYLVESRRDRMAEQ